jgi:acyl-[acyl-carrier-protein]-phospholipid O-acyltransferase/long-chain-fatty-acid--[acyl-carrier-protein] ligase
VALLVAGEILLDELKQLIDQSGLNPLMRPAQIIPVQAIPKLGSGKSDFNRAREIALEGVGI